MTKEENKKEKPEETIENNNENSWFTIPTLLYIYQLLNSSNSFDIHQKNYDFDYLKELYHSLDKRISILESKSKKKFL